MITRWDHWYSPDNLNQDERILAASSSQCAEYAVTAFLARGQRRILDLACGVGRDTFYLESRGLDVVGVDVSCNSSRASQRLKSERGALSEFVTADARRLPFGDGSFEGVYCFGLLHEFTDAHREQEVERVMAEIQRVLNRAGALVLAVLAGDPEAGLPAVQLFSRQMFKHATWGWRSLEIKLLDDVGCTGREDYRVWYGVFER